MKTRGVLALVLLAGAAGTTAIVVAARRRPPDWPSTLALVRERYPEVPPIRTGELAARLAGPAAERPVLLDVRSAEEFRLSRIPGARRVEPGSGGAATLRALGLAPGTPVVAYCSVGMRSAALVRELRAAGHDGASLEGGIFAWANEGRPLEDDAGPATRVHPFDARWGTLLHRSRRGSAPPRSPPARPRRRRARVTSDEVVPPGRDRRAPVPRRFASGPCAPHRFEAPRRR